MTTFVRSDDRKANALRPVRITTGYLLTAEGMAWFMDAYKPDPTDYRGSPLDFDQSGMPPSLVTTAGLDPLRSESAARQRVRKRARKGARQSVPDRLRSLRPPCPASSSRSRSRHAVRATGWPDRRTAG